MTRDDEVEKTQKERDPTFVGEQWLFKTQTAGIWIGPAIGLKRAYDALHHIAELGRQRSVHRLCAFAQKTAEIPTPDPEEPRGFTPEELSDFLDELVEPVALMVLGLAIENLLKSILIRRGLLVSENGKLKIPGKPHNLPELAVKCGLALDAEEKTALDVLSHYSTWAGRYSVPKTMEDYKAFWVHQSHGEIRPQNEALQRLYDRIYSEAQTST